METRIVGTVSPYADPLHVAMTVEQLWQSVPGGSGTYVRALAAALEARDDVVMTGIAARGAHAGEHGLPASLDLGVSVLPRRFLYQSWSRLRRPGVPRSARMRRDGRRFDVVHATTWAVPPRTAPLVVAVHDVAFLRNPEHFTPHGVAFFQRALEATRRDADIVIVPSEATRSDCLDAGIDAERIRLVSHGTEAQRTEPADVAAFRARHGLHRDFVLWCGTLEPRKNVSSLLAAFRELASGDPGLDLVLVGPHGWGETSAEVRAAATALPTDRLHVLGKLSQEDLQLAYAGARVFCFPSLWEGFGMPVLEAMVHGTPVVTSRGTSMAEIAQGGALLVDPLDPTAIAAAITEAAGPSHAVLSAGGRANAATFTWERSAEQHVAAYRDAVELSSTGAARRSGTSR